MKAIIVLDALENQAKVQRVGDDADIMRTIYGLIGCDCVQMLPLYPDRIPKGFLALCDENTYGKAEIFNPLASWLYGCDDHGACVTRNAVIVKEIPEDFDFMTEEEARKICDDLNAKADDIFIVTMDAVVRARRGK